MTNTVEENLRRWDRDHAWPEDGDEWKGQARACGVSYEAWKQSLIDHLIAPYAPAGSTVVEIAPGHGRWTEAFAERAGRLVLVDLSTACLDYCRRRFSGLGHLEYRSTDGSSLPEDLTGQVDLVWSFDSFVHIAPADIARYMKHIERVLRPGGQAVIHHANRRHWSLGLSGIRHWGPFWTRIYRFISMGLGENVDGWRSPVSARLFRSMAERAGLEVVGQINRWGARGRYGVPRHNDRVTILLKPKAAEIVSHPVV